MGLLLLLCPGLALAADSDRVLLGYVDVWKTGEVERLEDLVAPDFRRHAGPDESVGSRAALTALVTEMQSVYDQLEFAVDDYVTEGDRGAFIGSFRGVHKAVGGVAEFEVMSMFRFSDGLIAEEWVVGNNFLTLIALGYELVPPGFEAFLPGETTAAPVVSVAPGEPEKDLPVPVPELTPSSPAVDGNEAVLEAYIEAWNQGDVDALDELLREDYVRHGHYGSAKSRDELKQNINRFRSFYKDLAMDLQDRFAGNEKGAMRWRFTGGYAGTSFVMNSLNFSMVRFDDGKIAEEWVLGNTTDFWTSMGYRILPPGTKMVPPPVQDPPGARVPPPPDFGVSDLAAAAATMEREAPPKAGSIKVVADVACRLSLDGKPIGGLEKGGSVVLPVERGDHRLEASSRGRSVFFQESVRVKKDRTTEVRIKSPARAIVHPRNRTIEDLESGLMWQMTDNGSDLVWSAAEAYCSESSAGGYNDWRLPSIYELEKLYAPDAAVNRRFKTIDGISLSGCCPWTVSEQGDFHWTFIFYNGLRYIKHQSISKLSRALCVRHAR